MGKYIIYYGPRYDLVKGIRRLSIKSIDWLNGAVVSYATAVLEVCVSFSVNNRNRFIYWKVYTKTMSLVPENIASNSRLPYF